MALHCFWSIVSMVISSSIRQIETWRFWTPTVNLEWLYEWSFDLQYFQIMEFKDLKLANRTLQWGTTNLGESNFSLGLTLPLCMWKQLVYRMQGYILANCNSYSLSFKSECAYKTVARLPPWYGLNFLLIYHYTSIMPLDGETRPILSLSATQ